MTIFMIFLSIIATQLRKAFGLATQWAGAPRLD
jgi:hypothetical protein